MFQAPLQPEHILVVDSNIEASVQLASYLQLHGYKVSIAKHGEEMFNILECNICHLVVMEVNLIGDDGLALCRKLRQQSSIPLIFISAPAETIDRIIGLEIGADDYMARPFEAREMLARIRAVMRRTFNNEEPEQILHPNFYKFGDWILDCNARHLISPDDRFVSLSGAEYSLLVYFLTHAKQVVSRDQLLEVQGKFENNTRSPFDRSIDVQISRLRARLREGGDARKFIKTVRGDGYVFATNVLATNE